MEESGKTARADRDASQESGEAEQVARAVAQADSSRTAIVRNDQNRPDISRARFLIVEDDPVTQELLSAYLKSRGFEFLLVDTGRALLREFDRARWDMLLLDLTLPDEDGLVLIRRLRMRTSVPMIVLTAREQREARLTALDLGADDYMHKPLDLQELLLRVRNLLLRSGFVAEAPKRLGFADWELDLEAHLLRAPDRTEIALSPAELRLLAVLARSPNRVFSRALLLDAVARGDDASERMIDVLISRLRRKLNDDPRQPRLLVTVPRAGYRLVPSGA